MISLRTAAAAFVALAPGASFAKTLYCPWADTVVRIELSADGTAAMIEDGAGSIKSVVVHVASERQGSGAATVDTFAFSITDGAWEYTFLIEHWPYGDMLWNFRRNRHFDRDWTQHGWCIGPKGATD